MLNYLYQSIVQQLSDVSRPKEIQVIKISVRNTFDEYHVWQIFC